MSTPEILMLLAILPKALREHPEWFTEDHAKAAGRMIYELQHS